MVNLQKPERREPEPDQGSDDEMDEHLRLVLEWLLGHEFPRGPWGPRGVLDIHNSPENGESGAEVPSGPSETEGVEGNNNETTPPNEPSGDKKQ